MCSMKNTNWVTFEDDSTPISSPQNPYHHQDNPTNDRCPVLMASSWRSRLWEIPPGTSTVSSNPHTYHPPFPATLLFALLSAAFQVQHLHSTLPKGHRKGVRSFTVSPARLLPRPRGRGVAHGPAVRRQRDRASLPPHGGTVVITTPSGTEPTPVWI